MSIAISRDPNARHTIVDDMESFLWVLLGIALRRLPHTYRQPVMDIFNEKEDGDNEDEATGGELKARFLEFAGGRFECDPLEELISGLRTIFAELYQLEKTDDEKFEQRRTSLMKNPSEILAVFDKVLTMEGWPGNDQLLWDKLTMYTRKRTASSRGMVGTRRSSKSVSVASLDTEAEAAAEKHFEELLAQYETLMKRERKDDEEDERPAKKRKVAQTKKAAALEQQKGGRALAAAAKRSGRAKRRRRG